MYYEIEIQDQEPITDDFKYTSVIRFTLSDYDSACRSLMYSLLFTHSKSVTVKVTLNSLTTKF